MLAHFRQCESDEDLARFTLYFIQNRKDFTSAFTLYDTVDHVLQFVQQSHIILIEDDDGTLIGWGHYRYMDKDHGANPNGEIAFVDSVIVKESYRSSRIFIQGFRYLANQMAEENPEVKLFQFHALSENLYLNRLYSKFAQVIATHEGYHGTENIYSTEFSQLLHYLNR
ncbi:GNAT family N-acetyltransferase [Paenibacillus sp. RC67]|uniref:GNAT family N-acetyltransferase n=1 Tax=Paenibacillus sp. RC67 TaxID=3039392 RepID=UPI0024AE3453|nr:GNAT family N-acetyltransferase [Paenibacillus sp. RC67]